jgi:hypothetical protein
VAQLRFSGLPTRIHGLGNDLVSFVGVVGVFEICLMATSWGGGHCGRKRLIVRQALLLPECQEEWWGLLLPECQEWCA